MIVAFITRYKVNIVDTEVQMVFLGGASVYVLHCLVLIIAAHLGDESNFLPVITAVTVNFCNVTQTI